MLRSVAVLALDQLAVFEFGILCEVFGIDRTDDGLPRLDFRVCGTRAGEVISSTGGAQVVAGYGLDGMYGADLIAIPATARREDFPPEALRSLREAAGRDGTTVLTICSGVFVAGAAGLLDGRRCTTHWRSVDELRARHPSTIVDPDVLFVDDGDLVTSAGSAAGMDACTSSGASWAQPPRAHSRGSSSFLPSATVGSASSSTFRSPSAGTPRSLPPWTGLWSTSTSSTASPTSPGGPTCPYGASPAASSPRPEPARTAG
jgi:putative intracellular protease/amidase